eukprot:NODE_5459_length_580_cov_176.131429.p1 GENE.NODE_5459_length_580_cov_176.131429~~NODE_5459_length_580_cov_176.131429.p1  ORF type:complete len:122 (-),score=55.49 NODE_5459_length_580_cov_176.131429:197-562(-)
MGQAETEERKGALLRLEQEKHELQAKVEDSQLQMQIVQEERDSLREAMEQLWKEKSVVEEELYDRMQGYNYLTERFNKQQDEYCDLESQVEKKSLEVAQRQREGLQGTWRGTSSPRSPVST